MVGKSHCFCLPQSCNNSPEPPGLTWFAVLSVPATSSLCHLLFSILCCKLSFCLCDCPVCSEENATSPLPSPASALSRHWPAWSVPLAAPIRNFRERCHLFLHPEQLLCSVGKDAPDVTSEFAKALSSTSGVYTTLLDHNDEKAPYLPTYWVCPSGFWWAFKKQQSLPSKHESYLVLGILLWGSFVIWANREVPAAQCSVPKTVRWGRSKELQKLGSKPGPAKCPTCWKYWCVMAVFE